MGDMVGSRQKILILLLLFTMTISLSSCGNSEPRTTIDRHLQHSKDSVEGRCARILKCLSDGDKETLKDMFSPKAKRRKRLDKEIDKAMEFFEGKVLEYYPYVSGGDDLAIDNGKTTLYSESIQIKKIKTDSDKIYSIYGLYYTVNDKDPESIGLSYLSIYDYTDRDPYDLNAPSVDIGN